MRKRVINEHPQDISPDIQSWLDLEHLAQVEFTSEDTAHPVEAALTPVTGSGWRASQAGEQTIRLTFDEPQRIRRICILFHENQQERTQEFVLRWSPDRGQSYREIVRQQYTFSPPGTTREYEDYTVNIEGVTVFELRIIPDIRGVGAIASLAELRLA